MDGMQKMHQLIRREQYMLNQFCGNLQATINTLVEKGGASTESLSTLTQRLSGELSWAEANGVELALVDHYDEISLLAEWQRRLAEINRLPQHLVAFYKEHSKESDTVKLRALLSRLVADIQWVSESHRVISFNESQMRKKIIGLFLFAFILFFSPTLFRTLFSVEFNNLRLYYVFTAASSGILGAAFSQLTSIQSRVQSASLVQIRAMSRLGYVVARSLVGAGAGLIMFYFVQSGLLSGAFFPEFIHTPEDLLSYQQGLPASVSQGGAVHGVSQKIEMILAIGTLAKPAQGLSLLIVWCLIAGFSEKMIPGILSRKAKEAESSS